MIIKISLVLLGVISQAFGLSLSDYSPYEYKVLFTNPECKLYEYEEPVYSNDGTLLTSKPKNVYCKKSDFELNSERADSPHYELKELISDKGLKSLFFAFLSFYAVHSTIQTTSDIYLHTEPGQQTGAKRAVDEALREARKIAV